MSKTWYRNPVSITENPIAFCLAFGICTADVVGCNFPISAFWIYILGGAQALGWLCSSVAEKLSMNQKMVAWLLVPAKVSLDKILKLVDPSYVHCFPRINEVV